MSCSEAVMNKTIVVLYLLDYRTHYNNTVMTVLILNRLLKNRAFQSLSG